MTVCGRRLPFAGIAKAIDCVTATKGWSRPKIAVSIDGTNGGYWIAKQPFSGREQLDS
jgi:hypothetical protein